MPSSLSALPNDFSPETSYSAAFLVSLLNATNSLIYSSDGKWQSSTTSILSNGTYKTEKIVLVGQAINIASLHKILQHYFAAIQWCEISLHPLHGQFSQQSVTLCLMHSQNDNMVNTHLLSEISQAFFIDCFAVSQVLLEQPGLLVMDMDSTIIDMECIDEIAGLAGVGDKVSELTERAMLGELDFNQSLYARVGCLNGIDLKALEALKSRLPINPGFAHTIALLQQHGWRTVIASGGFTYFANYLKDTFELSQAFSNTLGFENGKLTGTVQGDIVNGEMKLEILLQQLQQHNISQGQSIAIGDGANDLLMMSAAALGVAYKAKPKVKAQANACIEYCGFEGLLYCLAQ